MSALTEKIKKFFEGWCSCGSDKKAAQPPCGEESKPQEETKTCEKPEGQQQSGS